MTYITPQMVTEIRREMIAMDPTGWVPRVRFGDLLVTLIAAIPYAVGWALGFVYWVLLVCVAAVVAGFKAGWGNK